MTPPKPDDAHRWLHQLVGTWTYEMPSSVPDKLCTGTERVRKLGDLWVVGESDMTMPDGNVGHAIVTLGFEPKKRKYVGTWVGTMMPNLWVYEGELDPAGNVLSLYSRGPSFDDAAAAAADETQLYRDAIELRPDGTRRFTGSVQNADGSWKQFMESTYRRVG